MELVNIFYSDFKIIILISRYLVVKGKTAIEFWGDKLLPNDPRV